jgi:phage terminase large subunit
VNELVLRALYTTKKNPKYAYIAPFYAQAKNIAWEYLKEAARPFIASVKDIRESDLSVKLVNGSTIRLYGADNIDALRGIYLDGVVIDEFGDCRPGLWAEVILPTLSDRKGWAAIIGTPKGKNTFYDMTENAKTDDAWYFAELKASETGIVDPEELASMKLQMTDAQYDQEMECSFTAPVLGTYYAGQIETLEKKGQIYSPHADYDPNYAVSMALDLGFTDSTSVWYWQPKPDGYSIIDYDEAHSQPLAYYFDLFESKPYVFDTVWLPHDARAKTLQTGRSTIEQFLEQGLSARIVPHLKVQQGIDAARLILNDCYFNEKTKQGVEGLRAYRRRFNEITKVFSDAPLHDWASNAADAFRYFALICQKSEAVPLERKQILDGFKKKAYTLKDLFKDRESGGSQISRLRM